MSKRCPCCGKKMQHTKISDKEVAQCPHCGYVENVAPISITQKAHAIHTLSKTL